MRSDDRLEIEEQARRFERLTRILATGVEGDMDLRLLSWIFSHAGEDTEVMTLLMDAMKASRAMREAKP